MRLLFLVVFTLVARFMFGQNIAELESKLLFAKDTARVKILNQLSLELTRSDSAKSLQYADEGLKLAKELEYHEGVARALRNQGLARYFASDNKRFFQMMETSNQYAIEHEIWPVVADNYQNMAGMYVSVSSNYNLALEYYLKAYDVYEKHNPRGAKYVPLLGISATYKNQAQYDKALEYIDRAIPLIEEAKDERQLAVALENAASVYWLKRDLQRSKDNYQKAFDLFGKVNSKGGQIFCLIGLANIAREQGDYDQAMAYGEKALALGEEFTQYERARIYGMESIGKTLVALNRYPEAQKNFEKGLAIAQKLKMPQSIRDFYENLAKVAAAQKDFQRAYEYQSKFTLYADSVLNAEMSKQLSEVRTRFETEKKEAEIEILKRDNQISKFYFATAVATMLGVIIFGYLVITRQRLKNRKDRELAAVQNQVLEERTALTEEKLKNKELAEINLRNELAFKNKELTTHTLNLIQKNESLENIKRLVEEIRLMPDSQIRPKLTSLINTVNFSFNLDRDWESFKLHFEKVHQGFFEKLLKDFPDLNGNDLKLCALMKLNMETKEIATVIDISPESAKVARHRLRKKLNLVTEQNLSSFLAAY